MNLRSMDIAAYLDAQAQRSPTTPVSSDAEVPEVSQHTAPLEPHSERPRKKQHQRRVPPATKAPGSIGRQARDKTSRTSSVDSALDAVFAQDSVEENLGSHSMYSEPASSAYPAVKTPGSSPRNEGYGSPADKTPRFQVPKEQVAKVPEPFVPPRLASDPRLRESSQHLETEHLIDDSAVHRYTLFFAHGTNTAGAEGIMNSCYLAPATLADGLGAVGHYSQATNWSDQGSLQQILDRCCAVRQVAMSSHDSWVCHDTCSSLRSGIRRGTGSAASLHDSCSSSLQAGQEVSATFRPHHSHQLCSQETVSTAQGSSWKADFSAGAHPCCLSQAASSLTA